MKLFQTASALLLSATAIIAPVNAFAESNNFPSWIPLALELRDEIRKAGYMVVWGEGNDCVGKVFHKQKIAVVCGAVPINDLHKAILEIRTKN